MVLLRRLLPSSALVAGLAIAALAVSCKDKPAENAADAAATTPPATSSGAPAAAEPAALAGDGGADEGKRGDRGERSGHGGPAVMLFEAARGLELANDQKAKIEAAEKAAHAGAGDASHDALKVAAKELRADLVAGIKAGKVDAAKLEPRYAAIDKVAVAAHEKEAEALTALHGALDATQRKAVVASVRAKQAAREEKMARRNERADAGGGGGGGGGRGGKGPGSKRSIARLTRGLELDAEQQKKIDALAPKDEAKGGRPDMAETKKSTDALLVAFEKDTFDAKKVSTFEGKKARGPLEQESKLLAQIVPILKPEQREKLAVKMDQGASPNGRRGGFGHRAAPDDDNDD